MNKLFGPKYNFALNSVDMNNNSNTYRCICHLYTLVASIHAVPVYTPHIGLPPTSSHIPPTSGSSDWPNVDPHMAYTLATSVFSPPLSSRRLCLLAASVFSPLCRGETFAIVFVYPPLPVNGEYFRASSIRRHICKVKL